MHHALTDKARSLVSQIAKLDAELLETLTQIFREKVYAAEGFPSMHAYCVACLGLSDSQAYRHLQAARLMERHPSEVRGLLESGQASLTHLSMIASVVTNENAAQVFNEVRGKSTREVERIVRREDPKHDVSEAVERAATPRKESVELLAPGRWALRANMDDATKALYDEVVDLLAFDQRTPGNMLRLALAELKERLLIAKRRRIRSAARPTTDKLRTEQPRTDKPQTEQPRPAIRGEHVGPQGSTRYVPADIARLVYERDNNRCQFVADSGQRCLTTRDLQLHHKDPWARGGATTAENLTVYCRCHNLYQGELDFGPRELAA